MMKNAILLAGLAHFGILIASANVPSALNWRESFKALPLLLRQLFWVYGFFIVFMIVAFGIISIAHAETLAAASSPLARWLAGGIAAFWAIRTGIQWFYYSANHWRGKARESLIHWILTLVYGGWTVIYLLAAIR